MIGRHTNTTLTDPLLPYTPSVRSGAVDPDAQLLQVDAERARARELQLDRRLAPGHRSEERAQGDERLAVEARVGERRSRIDGLLVGLQGPVEVGRAHV